MFTLPAIVVATNVAVDQFTGSLIAYNILNVIPAPIFPVFVPRLCVVALIRRELDDPDACDLSTILMLGDMELSRETMRMDFAGMRDARAIFFFHGVAIPAAGDLIIKVRSGEVVFSDYVVHVIDTSPHREQQPLPFAPPPAVEPQ